MSKARTSSSGFSASASMKTGFSRSSAARASSQNEVGTRIATSQRKPSMSASRTQNFIAEIIAARSPGAR